MMENVCILNNGNKILYNGNNLSDVFCTYGGSSDGYEKNKFSLKEVLEGSKHHKFSLENGELSVVKTTVYHPISGIYKNIPESHRPVFKYNRKSTLIIFSLVKFIRDYDNSDMQDLIYSEGEVDENRNEGDTS